MNPTTTLQEAVACGYVVTGPTGHSSLDLLNRMMQDQYRRHCLARAKPFVVVGPQRGMPSLCWIEVDLIGLPYTLDGPSFVAINKILTDHHAGKVGQSNFSASKRYLESKRILTSDVADVLAAILAVLAMPGAFAPIPGLGELQAIP